MDTFFISHGTRTMAIDEGLPARLFLKSWRDKVFKEKPSSILMISAHWETIDPTVNVVDQNSTINDFSGAPKQMYQFKYDAPGAPRLAMRVKDLLTKSGFNRVKEAKTRGLDHGAWVPLMLMYPEADMPVCQLSVQTKLDGTHHYNMGKSLAPLRDEGVLIIGSGSATHNLRPMGDINGPIYSSRALEFDAWLKESLINRRHEDIRNYEGKAPQARIAHPWPDHLYPLHVALGAAGEKARAQLIHQSWSDDLLSYASYRFTTATPSPCMNGYKYI